jgi:hypothetical protein
MLDTTSSKLRVPEGGGSVALVFCALADAVACKGRLEGGAA